MPCVGCGGSPYNKEARLLNSNMPDLPNGGYSLAGWECEPGAEHTTPDHPAYFVSRGTPNAAVFSREELKAASEHQGEHGGLLFAIMAHQLCPDAAAELSQSGVVRAVT